MGVPKLWEILRPAGTPRSLTHLAVVDGFEANQNGKRGLRVGIDVSIWFIHAQYGKEGENPELRTLFFRCCRLMSMPFLPIFVFDGPKRPKFKRGRWIDRKPNKLVQSLQNMINVFGFEWRTAPGEAEAELAYLNQIGVIDAVLTDDVDTFLFGAHTLIRNSSNTLSGNKQNPTKNSAGKDDGNHTMVYTSQDILNHPDIRLTQAGLILIGVLSGGDYGNGLEGCGITLAAGLARAGLGETLVNATHKWPDKEDPKLLSFLETWRAEVREELKTNKSGHLPRKAPTLAAKISITDSVFPDLDVLFSYTHPLTSASPKIKNLPISGIQWAREPDIGGLARLCERHFEWGVREIVLERFRTLLWGAMVGRVLRVSVLKKDRKETRSGRPETPTRTHDMMPGEGTPSNLITKYFSSLSLASSSSPLTYSSDSDPERSLESNSDRLIKAIHSSRRHPTTDNLLEYRLEISPTIFTQLANAGIVGERVPISSGLTDNEWDTSSDDGGSNGGGKKGKKKGNGGGNNKGDPARSMRVWVPAVMVSLVEPELVKQWEEKEAKKQAKKLGSGSRKKATAGSPSRIQETEKGACRKKIPQHGIGTIREEAEVEGWSDQEDSEGELPSLANLPARTASKNPSTHIAPISLPSRPSSGSSVSSTKGGDLRCLFVATKSTSTSTLPKSKLRPAHQPHSHSLPTNVLGHTKDKDINDFIDLTTPVQSHTEKPKTSKGGARARAKSRKFIGSKIQENSTITESGDEIESANLLPSLDLSTSPKRVPVLVKRSMPQGVMAKVDEKLAQKPYGSALHGLPNRTHSDPTTSSRPTSAFPLNLDALFGAKRAASIPSSSVPSKSTSIIPTPAVTSRIVDSRPKERERRIREPVSVPSSPEISAPPLSPNKGRACSPLEPPGLPKSPRRSKKELSPTFSRGLSTSPSGVKSTGSFPEVGTGKSKNQTWMDLSSDSEEKSREKAPKRNVAPLMKVRSRKITKSNGERNSKDSRNVAKEPMSTSYEPPENEIIDLCSD